MPDYGKRAGRDVTDDILIRLREAEREIARLKSSNRRTTFDRGDKDAITNPFEGQTLIQYDDEKTYYYSNGQWRQFGSSVQPIYSSYTPALTAATSNPTIGSAGVSTGDSVYWAMTGGPPAAFVVSQGTIDFAGTPGTVTAGTGAWSVSVPFNIDSPVLLARAYLRNLFSSPDQLLPLIPDLTTGTGDRFQFWYPATYPVGDLTLFDSTSAWTLADGDRLKFEISYYTNDTP